MWEISSNIRIFYYLLYIYIFFTAKLSLKARVHTEGTDYKLYIQRNQSSINNKKIFFYDKLIF